MHSRKARNKHIYELKILFFKNDSPYQIATHVLNESEVDANGEPYPMTLCCVLKPPLTTAKEVSQLLMSPEMRANPVFDSHFVSAIGSGLLTKIKRQKITTSLAKFISVD